MYGDGDPNEVNSVWETTRQLAERLGDTNYRLRAFWGLWINRANKGDVAEALNLIGLLAVVGTNDPAVERAAEWLLAHQNDDGSWEEEEFTGTGFPCVFYLKYHLYRNSFPLYALARFRNQTQETKQFCALTFQPAEFRLRSGF